MNKIYSIYKTLFKLHGPQGWWPTSLKGYHPLDYSYPRNISDTFEICIGAILTQNTAWSNVEKALKNLQTNKLLNANAIINSDIEKLKLDIKPSGYYNQKAKKTHNFFKIFQRVNRNSSKK